VLIVQISFASNNCANSNLKVYLSEKKTCLLCVNITYFEYCANSIIGDDKNNF